MAVTEQQRHRLFRRVEEMFGPEEAATFMEVVLPAGVSELATKRDLEYLADQLRAELHRELRTQLFAMIGANATMLGGAVAIAHLF